MKLDLSVTAADLTASLVGIGGHIDTVPVAGNLPPRLAAAPGPRPSLDHPAAPCGHAG